MRPHTRTFLQQQKKDRVAAVFPKSLRGMLETAGKDKHSNDHSSDRKLAETDSKDKHSNDHSGDRKLAEVSF